MDSLKVASRIRIAQNDRSATPWLLAVVSGFYEALMTMTGQGAPSMMRSTRGPRER